MNWQWEYIVLYIVVPILFGCTVLYALFFAERKNPTDKNYRVRFKLKNGRFKIDNIRRGASIIGSAGSGKTESVIYNFLQHFSNHGFCGVIHDYKDFELTEIAYPLFREKNIKFYTIAFDQIHFRVNPIAPKYLPNEESVNEVSRVLMENLLEQNLSENSGSNKFFSDAVEGLLSGMIWKMKMAYPDFCTLPHIIALFQSLSTKKLAAFLKSDLTSMSMASAFINGIESEKQTAGVKSTLANAFKKISSQKLFYVLSKDEVPLDINNPEHPAVVSLVNHPKYDTAYSPVIAMIMHTIIKQMSVRGREPSFLLMEEAPTLKLPNMHRIPATLRSYNICTVYVMQDKIQNDLLIEAFKNYVGKHKGVFYDLPLEKKLQYIERAIQKDIKFRNSLKGMIIGQFTVEEYRDYISNSSALNKRMMNMVIERLKDQVQLLDHEVLLQH